MSMLRRNLTRLRRSLRIQQGCGPYHGTPLSMLSIDIMHLILEILSEGDSRTDLLNLALTCRALWIFTRQYIPKDVTLYAHSNDQTFVLFQKSVNKDHSYGRNVRHLTFTTGEKSCNISARKIRKLLQSLPALHSLDLGGLPYDHIVPTLFAKPLQMKYTLKKLDIPGGLDVKDVAELISFPVIRKWRFWLLDDFEFYSKFPKAATDIWLKELSFEDSQIAFPLFANVLRRCRNLQLLECNLPLQRPLKEAATSREREMETFSAINLAPSLMHVAKTLTKLQLYDDKQIWRKYDGSRLDLSSFSKLKNIDVPAMLFLAPISQNIRRGGVYKLFPLTAETIKLKFPANIGIFYSTSNGKLDAEEYSQFLSTGVDATQSDWIQEFAINKSFKFPGLQELSLLENTSSSGNQAFNSQNWLQPYWIRVSFDEAQIQLKVSLRKNLNI